MFLIVSKYLIPKGYRGLTIFPFVIVKFKEDKENPILLNHERLHIRQQLELLVLPFFIWYLLEYCIRLLYYKNSYLAYKNISFERECYRHEQDLNFLKKRTFFNFLKFIFR
jgi:hypothetical protein|nr:MULTISPECIES: hypothetical protein [unclassified Flavobacterium]